MERTVNLDRIKTNSSYRGALATAGLVQIKLKEKDDADKVERYESGPTGNITVTADGKITVDPKIYEELYSGAQRGQQDGRKAEDYSCSGVRDEEKHLARAIVGAYKLTQPKLTVAELAAGKRLMPFDLSQINDPCMRRRVAAECRSATPSIKTTYGANAEMEQRDKKHGGSLQHIADTVFDKTFGALGRAMGMESWGIVRASAKQVGAQKNEADAQRYRNIQAGKTGDAIHEGVTEPTQQVNQRLR